MVADPTLLNPKEFPIMCQDGKEKTLIFSKIPAVQMREIICKITAASVPDIEKYEINQETMLKMMAYVAVPMKTGVDLRLTTAELVNSHIPDWEALDRAEKCLLQYNCSFFFSRQALNFLRAMPSDGEAEGHRNIDNFIATIVSDGKATLHELKTVYDLEEAFLLWDCIAVSRYNNYMAQKNAQKRR